MPSCWPEPAGVAVWGQALPESSCRGSLGTGSVPGLHWACWGMMGVLGKLWGVESSNSQQQQHTVHHSCGRLGGLDSRNQFWVWPLGLGSTRSPACPHLPLTHWPWSRHASPGHSSELQMGGLCSGPTLQQGHKTRDAHRHDAHRRTPH